MKKETKEKIREIVLPREIKWKRVIALGVAILVVLLLLQVVAASGVKLRSNEVTHYLRIYDAEGRYLDPKVPAVKEYLQVDIYKSNQKTLISETKGQNNISFQSDEGYAFVKIFWVNKGNPIYMSTIPLSNTYVKLSLPFNPAKPIENWQAEALSISASGKSISTPFYGVTFGVGDNKNIIQLTIGSKTWNMPVVFSASTSNSSSDNIPFKFLAEQPGRDGMVSGDYNTGFLWLDHVKYASAYSSQLINSNTLVIAWTYTYYVNYDAHDFVMDVVEGAVAGAIVGSVVPGIGTSAGSASGAIAGAIAWAIHKYLVGSDARAYVGVVAAVITPRYLLLQAVTGKCNLDGATTEIQSMPAAGRFTDGTISYEVETGDGQLQIGFTKNWNLAKTTFYDFETPGQADGWSGGVQISDAYAYEGNYGLQFTSLPAEHEIAEVKKGGQYTITLDYYVDLGSATSSWTEDVYVVNSTGAEIEHFTYDYGAYEGGWKHHVESFNYIATQNDTLYIKFNDQERAIDNFKYEVYNNSAYRYIFTTSAPNPVVDFFPPGSGEIPVIEPASNGFSQTLKERYTLIAIKKMNDTAGVLALDWASREPVMAPARVTLGGGGMGTRASSSGWSVSVWLIGTDDKDGFKYVNFTYVTQNYVWTPDFGYNPMWSNNWTIVHNFTTLVVNGSMIIIPQFVLPTLGLGAAGWWDSIDWGNILKWIGIGIFALLVIAIVAKVYFNRRRDE